DSEDRSADAAPVIASWRLCLIAFCTGALGISYGVLGIRVLSQISQNTVYSYAGALAAYLAGTTIGAAAYQRWLVRRGMDRFHATLAALLIGASASCLVGILLMSSAPTADGALKTLGDSLIVSAVREMVVSGLVFALPTIFMGAMFSHLVQAA